MIRRARELTVVRLPSWLGDAVMAEPVLRALCGEGSTRRGETRTDDSRRAAEGALGAEASRVRVVAPRKLLELFDGRFADVERCPLSAEDPERPEHYAEAGRVLLLNGAWRSAWCAQRAGAPTRVGFASGGRGVLLTHPFVPARERGGVPVGLGRAGAWPRVAPRPFSAACRELASAIHVTVSDPTPRLEPTEAELLRARARLSKHGITGAFLLVHAGARPDSAKGFPSADMAAALARLLEREPTLELVLCCAPGEESAARATRDALAPRRGPSSPGRAVLLDDPAPGVGELVALTALSAGVITPDNGARHVAQALGRPTLVLCGPTDPRHTSEHAATTRVLRHDVPCGPCHAERCPLAGAAHHACMHGIGADRIAADAVELFRGRSDVRSIAPRPDARSASERT